MIKKMSLMLLAVSALLILTGTASAVDMVAGKWEVTSRVEMPGMPMQMPPMTNVQCLTKDKPAPSDTADSTGCTISEMRTEGNTVFWKVKCNKEGEKFESKGRITYHGTTFEGEMTAVMGQGAEAMAMKTIMNGKRIGSCD